MPHEDGTQGREGAADGIVGGAVDGEGERSDAGHEPLREVGSEIPEMHERRSVVDVSFLDMDFRCIVHDVPVVREASILLRRGRDHFIHERAESIHLAVLDGELQIPGDVVHGGRGLVGWRWAECAWRATLGETQCG